MYAHPAWAEEQEHLENTIEIVDGETRKAETELGIVDGEDRFVQVLDDSTNESKAELFALRNKLSTLKHLRLSRRQPYFARLSFKPDADAPVCGELAPGKASELYIGRWGVVQTPQYKLCVADWRSPVANLYYSGQVGRVSYDAPDGQVRGELSLKRMIGVEDGRLTSVQDTGLYEQEQYLIDALSKLSGSRLSEVVTTIQAEQNTVIRFDPSRPLCVQGVAGSGKTTIALHRIAWLMYRLQKTVAPNQMMIIAPNPLFLSYISRVLPDLGIDDVYQTTFAALCARLLGSNMPRIAVKQRLSERLDMSKEERDALDNVLRLKGALSLSGEIESFLSEYERKCLPKGGVMLGRDSLLTDEDAERFFLTEFRHFPLDVRRLEVRKVLRQRIKARLADVESALHAATEKRLDELLRSMPDGEERRERARKLFDSRDERLRELSALPKKLLADFDASCGSTKLLQVYREFLTYMAAKDERYAAVLEATAPELDKKHASPEDLPALLLLGRGLYGFSRLQVKQVVVDEAQDMSPLQLYVLRLFAGHDSFTLVGDLCQGIYGDEGIRSWGDIGEGIFFTEPTVTQLTVAYRSTVEIMNFAFSVMARHPVDGVGDAKPLLRRGEPPRLKRLSSASERGAAAVRIVRGWQSEGYGNIALIAKTERAAAALHKAIAKEIPEARLVKRGDDAFEGGVQVMDASVVKGLEFDCVLISDAEDKVYPDERFYAKLFYVLCTRPLHRLVMLAAGEPARHTEALERLFADDGSAE